MLKREPVKGSEQIKITFVIPHNPDQPRVWVVGDFNSWDPKATLLVKRSNNTRSASVIVDADNSYAFRYYTAEGDWFNDEAADAYETNEHGTHNCIVKT